MRPASATAQAIAAGREPRMLSKTEAGKIPGYQLWKRLGPSLPVPDENGKTRQLPAGIIVDLDYTPDGKLLAVAHSYGVDLWDTATELLAELEGKAA